MVRIWERVGYGMVIFDLFGGLIERRELRRLRLLPSSDKFNMGTMTFNER